MIDGLVFCAIVLLFAALISVSARWVAGDVLSRRLGKWRFPALLLIGAAPAAYFGLMFSNARSLQAFGEVIPRVDRTDKVVALTFDDGPFPAATPKILAILDEAEVRATFFVNGQHLARWPELGRRLVAAEHELGNHGDTHSVLIGRSLQTLQGELDRTDEQIRLAGHQGDIYFRPPYGKKFVALPWVLKESARTTVLWDIEPDGQQSIASDPEKIVAHVRDRVRPGSIILLHVMTSSRKPSLEAVPGVVAALKQDGYRFVTVSELLAAKN